MTNQEPSPVLMDLKDKNFKVIRDLGENEGAEYRRAVVHLGDFYSAMMLLPMIEAELVDFRAVIEAPLRLWMVLRPESLMLLGLSSTPSRIETS